jgi:hypothetical protein
MGERLMQSPRQGVFVLFGVLAVIASVVVINPSMPWGTPKGAAGR